MSQSFNLSQFPDLPPEVIKAFAAQQAALESAQFEASVERAARQHEQAVVAEKDAFITELKGLIEKLEGQVGQYRHAKFGPKSEKLDPAQLELALEDLETAIAETQAQTAVVGEKIAASAADPDKAAPRVPRKARALPETLPRVELLIEPGSIVCPCGCGNMVRIGEDRTERLDFIPARYQVIVTVRPCSATNWMRVRIAASKNVPEQSYRCLNRMFPGVLTPAEPRFGRLLMAVWRVKLPNCATRQTAISVCASPLTPNTNDLANSALQIFTRRCTVRSNMSG